MFYFYIDPSALVKRYHAERGTNLVNRLFEELKAERENRRMITSVWSIAESVAILNRAKNKLKMKEEDFAEILATFFAEIRSFYLLEVSDERALWSIPYILSHNINSSDALHLKSLLDAGKALELLGSQVILVAADKRFLRAAKDEGIVTVNPEKDALERLNMLLIAD